MRILQVVSSLSLRTGGPARAVLEISEVLTQLGQEVSIFSTNHGVDSNSFLANRNGFQVEFFKRGWPRRYFYSTALKNRLVRCIQNFDLVHIHGIWLYPTFIASRICQKEKIPYIIRPCGMLNNYSIAHHHLRKKIYSIVAERKNLDRAYVIHFVTEEEKERSMNFGLKSPTVVLPLGVQLEPYLNMPPKGSFKKHYPQLQGKKIVLFLGRITYKKGLDLLIRAFSRLLAALPNIHCVIAGPDDEKFGNRLRRLICHEKIQRHVTCIGFVEGDTRLALLQDSDIFCLPSYQENFGMALVEAMAAGLPVIISDQVNLHREIESSHAGLVTPCDPLLLEACMDRLLRDENLQVSMGRNGQKLVKEKYDANKVAKEWVQLYENIARRH